MSETTLPNVSVVVTCYNCRDYIGDAIRSVTGQTLKDFECVVVDDASTDDSAEVVRRTLEELGDARFSQVRLPRNVGQTGATRAGLAACFRDTERLSHEAFLARSADQLAGALRVSVGLASTFADVHRFMQVARIVSGAV